MKGLDTPVLLGILTGSPSVRPMLNSLAGEEIATTELNMLELAALAAHGSSRVRKERLQALERLRRRVTVLSLDRRVTEAMAVKGGNTKTAGDLHLNAILAAFEAAGCSQVFTDSRSVPARGLWKVKVTGIGIK